MTVHKPTLETFRSMVAQHPVVPVWREVLADAQTPVAAFMKLDPQPNGFLLESVEGGERWARYSFLGGDAFAVVKAKDGKLSVEGTAPVVPAEGEQPLAYVRRLLEALRSPQVEGLPPLHGGAVGFMGYDCVRELERLPDAPQDDLNLPDLALILTRTMVVFDHLLQKAFVIANVAGAEDPDSAYTDAARRCDEIVELLAAPLPTPAIDIDQERDVEFSSPVDDGEYEKWVEQAREHIYAGDIFQVVPSRRFQAPLEGSAFDAYRMLRTLNPSPYMYFLRFGGDADHAEIEIAGSSPEPLVRVEGDLIVTRPIAGTRRRGTSEAEDQAIGEELLADEKERAEHVMLVDLARNDVGRVARYGTVVVDELMEIERYSHVMHIVSNVTGRLAEGMTAFDALTACFPAGTVSGAPKIRAMEIIDTLEKTKRGPYAGIVGYFDFSGNLDTCITIRTIVATGGIAYVQAGAGIVADSVPAAEADETRRKAEALLRAVAAARSIGGRDQG
ncbi:MAG TPA: anthranilate synthase component I [Actinomycetota bacterium]|nr:anthranilate synthase component I [Actinomycetota bacterium]